MGRYSNMKREHILLVVRTVAIVIVSVAVTSMAISALSPTSQPSQGYTVLASVQPARYIVVDSNLQIKQVISNTDQDVIPYVVLSSLDGAQLPYTASIQHEFAELKPSLSFAKAGTVYERNNAGSLRGAFKSVLSSIRKFILGS